MEQECFSANPEFRSMTWSYTRANLFQPCKYHWYLRYVVHPSLQERPMFFSDYGTYMHKLLAGFYQGARTAADCELDFLLHFREHVRGDAPSTQVFQTYYSGALRCLRALKPLPWPAEAVEQKVRFTVGDLSMVGVLDYLGRDADGSLVIVDHKSRDLKPRSSRAKPTKGDVELDEYFRQLYLYAAAVRQLYGESPSKLVFHCFRSGRLIEEPFDDARCQAAQDWLLRRVDEIAAETKFWPDQDYFRCKYLCELHDACEYYQLNYGR